MLFVKLIWYWKKMAQVTITINSREYGIACDDGQEARILRLAKILDEKARMLTAGGGQINENMLLAMSGLLLADDLLEARQQKNNPTQNEPIVQTVEKVVEKIVEPDLSPLDEQLAQTLKEVTEKIKTLASEIETM